MSSHRIKERNPDFVNDYVESSWFEKLWMSWGYRMLTHINKFKTLDDPNKCIKMPDSFDTECTTQRMEDILEGMKND